jgi:HlyD family secretion protein
VRNQVKKVILVIVIVVIGAGISAWSFRKVEDKGISFRTVEVTRGNILSVINATGTVEPEELVDVGAQVAGQVISFGKDANGNTIDYGSQVEEGMVLAQIDPTVYESDVAQATAQLEQAKAGVESAQANLLQMNAKLLQAQLDWDRAQKLGPSDALAKSSYDSYKAAYETAKANVSVAQASILQSKAEVEQADATLQKAKRNLGYCTIKSPVNGVVIDRRVNIGQTVVSSLNAPSLFLIAKDLRKMQVWVSVNEADIGNIYPGQAVTFTVSAYEGRTFKGVVGKIRLNATMTQNVVTYTVEVITDNQDGKLLPYLTANVNFEVKRKDDVLRVANSALRWKPKTEQVSPEYQSELNESAEQGKGRSKMQSDTDTQKSRSSDYKKATLWISENGLARPVKVLAGASDDTMTEVKGEGLKEGMQAIAGEQQMAAAGQGTVNPFVTQFRRTRPAGQGQGQGQGQRQ